MVKGSGDRASATRCSNQAKAEGFGETLHLDSARHEEIDEFRISY